MRRCRFPWGGFLVVFGILFLLSNIVPFLFFNIWEAFWPLFIIWWGLRLLLHEGRRPSVPASPESAKQISGEVQYLSVPIKQVEEAHIRVKHSCGKLEIHHDTAPDEVLAGTFGAAGVTYEAEATPGDVLHLNLQSRADAEGPDEAHNWKFGLNREIPMSLNVSTGSSQGVLDLSGLQLTEIRLQSGTSDLTIMLPARAGYTLVHVESGAAAIRLHVPFGVAAHIRAKEGVAAVNVNEARFPPIGHVYESELYDQADNRIDIHINAGASNISVQ